MSLRAYTRVQPMADALQIIMKNTNFPDRLLHECVSIRFRLEFYKELPLFIFNFPEPRYDFLEFYSIHETGFSDWINQNPICVRLVLADSVFTDQFMVREFFLDSISGRALKEMLQLQQYWPENRIQTLETEVEMHLNRLLG